MRLGEVAELILELVQEVHDWLLQDVESLVNAGGRGTLRGVIRNPKGLIVASMAQEMLLRPVPR